LTDAVAVLLERRESFEVVEQAFYDGLENLRVHVREAIPPLLEVGEFRPQGGHGRQFTVFLLILVEAIERVVVQLPTNVSVTVQLLAVGVGRLETVFVGVVHGSLLALVLDVLFQHIQRYLPRRDEAVRVVPKRISPQFGLQFVRVLVADTAGGRALDRVDELHEVCGWFRSEQDVNVVVLSVEVRQFDTVVVREPADDLVNELGSLLG